MDECVVLLGDVGGTNTRLSLKRIYYNNRSKEEIIKKDMVFNS